MLTENKRSKDNFLRKKNLFLRSNNGHPYTDHATDIKTSMIRFRAYARLMAKKTSGLSNFTILYRFCVSKYFMFVNIYLVVRGGGVGKRVEKVFFSRLSCLYSFFFSLSLRDGSIYTELVV